MSSPLHIASVLVHAHSAFLKEVKAGILAKDGAEIAHADAAGRLIVTLETASEANIVSTLTDIQLLTGVVSASLVYHQTDGETYGETDGEADAAPASP